MMPPLTWQRIFTLRTVLIGYVVLPLLVVSAVAGYASLLTMEQQSEAQLQDEIALVARAIRLPVADSLEKHRTGSIKSALESVFRINRVYGAYIYDRSGNKLLAFGQDDQVPPKRHLADVAATGERQGEFSKLAGEEVYSYFVPLPNSSGQIDGLLQLTRQKSDFDRYVKELRVKLLIGLLVSGIIVTVFIVYGHERAIGRHLHGLVQSMQRVGGGDQAYRAPVGGPQEIRSLASALNTMLDNMARARLEIEQRQAAEAQLQTRLQQAEKFVAIGQVAAGVAHELGGPLTVIEGRAQRGIRSLEGQGRGDISEKARTILRDIRTEVARMEHTVRQLLDFGRKTSRRHRTLDADHLLHSSAATVRTEADLAGIHVCIKESGGSPAFQGDPLRIQQALINLLRNAIQAAPGGRVEAGVTLDEATVTFFIEDDGPGISPEVQGRLFEPFVTSKGPRKGSGLGLAVVHTVVDEHDGHIDVSRSRLGGAHFRMVFRRCQKQDDLGNEDRV